MIAWIVVDGFDILFFRRLQRVLLPFLACTLLSTFSVEINAGKRTRKSYPKERSEKGQAVARTRFLKTVRRVKAEDEFHRTRLVLINRLSEIARDTQNQNLKRKVIRIQMLEDQRHRLKLDSIDDFVWVQLARTHHVGQSFDDVLKEEKKYRQGVRDAKKQRAWKIDGQARRESKLKRNRDVIRRTKKLKKTKKRSRSSSGQKSRQR